jgi:hypothetical protein
MRNFRFLLSRPWFWLAWFTITLLLTACPGGGNSRY